MSAESFAIFKQCSTPTLALVLGALLHQTETFKVPAKLMVYFGAQTGMHLYMKAVLSNAVVSEELGLKGIPAAFLVTGVQQATAFGLFITLVALFWPTPWRYVPRRLSSRRDLIAVVCFSLSFALNIGLNNFCLSYLTISLNMIIRSCLPLSTALSHILLGACTGGTSASLRPKEFLVMLAGVGFTALATVAKAQASSGSGDVETLWLGVLVGTLSIFSGAINFVLAQFLGTSLKLNPLDTTCYMAMPAAVFLMVPIFLMPHPVSWPGFDNMTDWQVFLKVLELSPKTTGLVVLSGVFALSYNSLQYGLVQSLSATYTAFAGNFNKAATVTLSLLLGMEQLPPGLWGVVMLIAIVGNISSFSWYSFMKLGKGGGGH